MSRPARSESDSRLRITYFDNLRMSTAGKACSWDVVLCINGANCGSCSSGRISGDIYNSVAQNDHGFHVIEGYCDNVPAGSHTIKVDGGSTTAHVSSFSGGECYTGFPSALPHLRYPIRATQSALSHRRATPSSR